MFVKQDANGKVLCTYRWSHPDATGELPDNDPLILECRNPIGLLLVSIDQAAEDARLRYITPGAGQAAVYLAKAAEADSYKAAGYPSASTAYPLLTAEATATGQTKAAIADAVIAKRDAWMLVAGSIEGERIAGKAAVSAAVDIVTAMAARDNAIAALAIL